MFTLGFQPHVLAREATLERAWRDQTQSSLPPLKEFNPMMGLPKLKDYRKIPLAVLLTSWPKRTFEHALPTNSWVSEGKLRELALKYQYSGKGV